MPMIKDIIPRKVERIIREQLFKNKAIIIYGARQVGKTTLVEHLIAELQLKYAYLNGDDFERVKEIYFAYEFKKNPFKKVRFSSTFIDSYNVEQTLIISPDNIEDFIYQK